MTSTEVARPRCSCGQDMTQGKHGNGLVCPHCDTPCLVVNTAKCTSCNNQARSSRQG